MLFSAGLKRAGLMEMVSAAFAGTRPDRATAGRTVVDRSIFMNCALTRAAPVARTIVYAGDLSPHSGVADFFGCAIGWAERHPAARVEIVWAGRGDLEGVLRAQPLPSNLGQAFSSPATIEEVVEIFLRGGLLVVPSLSAGGLDLLAEAMVAGLPVVGSVRHADVPSLVVQGVTGWLFDPLVGGEMVAAFDAAMTTPIARLDAMREAARAQVVAVSALPSTAVGVGVRRWMPRALAAGGSA